MLYDFCELVRNALVKEMELYNQHVLSGNCKSYEDYKWVSGKLWGLNKAFEIIEEQRKELIK